MTRPGHVICLTIIMCPPLAAQNVTVEPGTWSESGIELTAYSSPDFAVKLAATALSTRSDITPLLPFSFFMTNNTGRKIVMYSVLWTVKYANGFVARRTSTQKSWDGSFAIQSGADRLITIVNGGTSPVADNPRTDTRLQAAVTNAVRMFPSDGTVRITLEAVLLDDGLALGTDSAHAISRVQAQFDAEKMLASDILAAFQSGGDQAVLDLLTSIVSQSVGPNRSPNALQASRMSSDSDAYAAFLADHRNTMARHYLGLAKSNPALLIKLQNKKATEIGIAVHR